MSICKDPTQVGVLAVESRWQDFVKRFAPAGVIAAVFVPWWVMHARELGNRPHYDYYPLIVPGAVALGYRALRRDRPSAQALAEGFDPRRSVRIALAGWVILAAGVLLFSPWFAALASLVTVLAAVDAVGGVWLVRRLLPAWGFLWLAIPPPRGPDEALLLGLRWTATRWSSAVLDGIGVPHVIDGNVIEIVGHRLLVEEACSGIHSLFSLTLGTIFLSLWLQRGALRTALTVAVAAAWVLVGNVARIVTIAYFDAVHGVDLSHGWRHSSLGFLIFMGMLGLVFSTDRLLESVGLWLKRERLRLLGSTDRALKVRRSRPAEGPGSAPDEVWALLDRRRRQKRAKPRDQEDPGPVAPPSWSWGASGTFLSSWRAAMAFALLTLPLAWMTWRDRDQIFRVSKPMNDSFDRLVADDMPGRIDRFSRVGFQSVHRDMQDLWGENSKLWSYQSGALLTHAAVDYPFLGWHELTVCYTSNGWRVLDRKTVGPGASAPPGGDEWVEAELVGSDARHAYLLFGLASRDGRTVPPPHPLRPLEILVNRLSQWLKPGGSFGLGQEMEVYQYQVLMVTDAPPTDEERLRVRAVFDELKARTRKFAGGEKGGPG